jgi:hypothetical protein
MFEQENGDRTLLVNEMETALTRLESTLVEASRAITTIRKAPHPASTACVCASAARSARST